MLEKLAIPINRLGIMPWRCHQLLSPFLVGKLLFQFVVLLWPSLLVLGCSSSGSPSGVPPQLWVTQGCRTYSTLVADSETSTSAAEEFAATSVAPCEQRGSDGSRSIDQITWDDATWILTSSFIIFTMQSGESRISPNKPCEFSQKQSVFTAPDYECHT